MSLRVRLGVFTLFLYTAYTLLMVFTDFSEATRAVLTGVLLVVGGTTAIAWWPGVKEIILNREGMELTRDDLLYVGVWLGWSGLSGLTMVSLILRTFEGLYDVDLNREFITGFATIVIIQAAVLHLIASNRMTTTLGSFNWRSVLFYVSMAAAVTAFVFVSIL